MRIANRIGLRVAAAAVATGAIAAGGLAVAGSAGASTVAASSRAAGQLPFPDPGQRHGPDVQPAARHQQPRPDRRVLRFRRRGHPNKGYLLSRVRPAQLRNENFPGSVQTQVTGLNDEGATVGFWSGMNNANLVNDNFGFYALDGHHFYNVRLPHRRTPRPHRSTSCSASTTATSRSGSTPTARATTTATPTTSAPPVRHGTVPGNSGRSLTAAAINDDGDLTGFYTTAAGDDDGFLGYHGHSRTLSVPAHQPPRRSASTAGTRWSASTPSAPAPRHDARLHLDAGHGFRTVDEPHGMAPPPSTASTTRATWSASTRTRSATPTGSWPAPWDNRESHRPAGGRDPRPPAVF